MDVGILVGAKLVPRRLIPLACLIADCRPPIPTEYQQIGPAASGRRQNMTKVNAMMKPHGHKGFLDG
jgi:hypothetical protein